MFYLGRIKKEKGIFSLLELVNKLTINFNLDIVGMDKIKRSKNKKVHYHLETSKKKNYKIFDKNNIFILPSYTEGIQKLY